MKHTLNSITAFLCTTQFRGPAPYGNVRIYQDTVPLPLALLLKKTKIPLCFKSFFNRTKSFNHVFYLINFFH